MDRKKAAFLSSTLGLVITIFTVSFFTGSHHTGGKEQPRGSDRQLDMAASLFGEHDFEGALRAISQISDGTNTSKDTLRAMVLAQRASINYSEKEDAPKAIESAKKALEKNPGNPDALRILGYAHETLREFKQALGAYNQALLASPDNPDILVARGHCYDLMGDQVKAIADYEAAYRLDRHNPMVLQNLARMHVRDLKFDLAEEKLKESLQYSTNARVRAEALFDLSSIALYKQGDLESSLRYAEQSAGADRSYPYAWVGQARIQQLKGNLARAKSLLSQAVALYPSLVAAHEQLGYQYLEEQNPHAALSEFNAASEMAAFDITLMDSDREAVADKAKLLAAAAESMLGDLEGRKAAAEKLQSLVISTKSPVVFYMATESIRRGEDGIFASLSAIPQFVKMQQLTSKNPARNHVASLLSFFSPQSAWAEIIRVDPHNTYHGHIVDNELVRLLQEYIDNEIEFEELQQQCEAIVWEGSGHINHCVLAGDRNSQVMTIGCTNVTIAMFVQKLTLGEITEASCLDNYSAGITGWACDMDSPGQAIQVRLLVDGVVRQTVTANQDSSDVAISRPAASACNGNTAHAFNFTESRFNDHGEHVIEVLAKDAQTNTWVPLPGSGVATTFACSSNKVGGNIYYQTCDSDDNQAHIAAWACDRGSPASKLQVRLYVDKSLKQTKTASSDSSFSSTDDAIKAHCPGGGVSHAVQFAHDGAKDGLSHSYSVKARDSTYDIWTTLPSTVDTSFKCSGSSPSGSVRFDCSKISGYACDSSNFNSALTVTIKDNGATLGTVSANEPMDTSTSACGGTSLHGFSFPFTPGDGLAHQITAVIGDIGTGQAVTVSAHKVTCFKNCTGPDGQIINHSESAIYYKNASVSCSSSCEAVERFCENGELSKPEASAPACIIAAPPNCTGPDGSVILPGDSKNYFTAPEVPAGGTCDLVARSCALCGDGTLQGDPSAIYTSCHPNCQGPDGSEIRHGSSRTYYKEANVTAPATCQAEERICTDGTLSPGSFAYPACSITGAADRKVLLR